jgi:hypothetical protein
VDHAQGMHGRKAAQQRHRKLPAGAGGDGEGARGWFEGREADWAASKQVGQANRRLVQALLSNTALEFSKDDRNSATAGTGMACNGGCSCTVASTHHAGDHLFAEACALAPQHGQQVAALAVLHQDVEVALVVAGAPALRDVGHPAGDSNSARCSRGCASCWGMPAPAGGTSRRYRVHTAACDLWLGRTDAVKPVGPPGRQLLPGPRLTSRAGSAHPCTFNSCNMTASRAAIFCFLGAMLAQSYVLSTIGPPRASQSAREMVLCLQGQCAGQTTQDRHMRQPTAQRYSGLGR